MLTTDQVSQFQSDGFVNGGQVLDDNTVEDLRSELERVIAERDRGDIPQPVRIVNLSGDDDHPVWQIVNIWQASKRFADLIRHPVITADAARLSGARELRVWHDQIQFKPAARGGVNHWHQDAPLWPILRPMTQITAWIALDDVDESNGCMSMVAGSHLWGDRIEYLNSLPSFSLASRYAGQQVRVFSRPVRKGAVHYHHALTWHGSHENTSERPRRAIAIHLMGGETTYRASGEHPMKRFVTVPDGAKLVGDAFPLVYEEPSA